MNTKARIATICQAGRFFPTIEQNRDYVLALARRAMSFQPDLICLPEGFTTPGISKTEIDCTEPIPGPTTDAFAVLARQHRSYMICPLRTRRDGCEYNCAVIIGRDGEIVGIYHKRRLVTSSHDYTLLESGAAPGATDGVFDLDFGRIGIRICFDINFHEDWRLLAQQDVRMVFWPSAYDGGYPLSALAAIHKYYLVSSTRTGRGRIIDPCGTVVADTDSLLNLAVRDINVDYVVCHYDFNFSIPDRILADYGERVEVRSHAEAACFLLEPKDPALTTDQLMRQYGFESLDTYIQRHRHTYESICHGSAPTPQSAAHGDRPMFKKTLPV
jgi:predicted amidohydrolase